MAVYVDTSAWIALHERRERRHGDAKAAFQELLTSHELLVTGIHTLVEFADGLVRHHGQAHAAQVIGRLMKSAVVRVDPSEAHWENAVNLFSTRADWNVDLSDCLSFSLMKAVGIRRAFTLDKDFDKPGFERIP